MTDIAEGRHLAASDPRLDVWRSFLLAHARLFRRLDEELRAEHGLSLPEYDALLQLAQSPERRLRMTQLASRVLLSKSGVTRLIDRLVADGYVARSQCSHDARGAEAVLTPEGLERLRAAATTHLRGIDTYFLGALDERDLATLRRSMDSVSRRSGDEPETDIACAPPSSTRATRPARTVAAQRAPAG
ncbi:MAG: MarR family winged helix-turn-helix transcriptional regulator [Chloroflexota bacterium]